MKWCFLCRRKSQERRTLPGGMGSQGLEKRDARMAWKVGRAIGGKLVLAKLWKDFAGPGVMYNNPNKR